jgi:DNA-directed RNA polymerase specialized sigma24 family protein
MSHESSFAEFIRRIRAGDAEAATQLVRQYEPVIRLEVRMRLSDSRLRRLFDSMDICQEVLGSFFVRAAMGQYDLDQPEQLLKLLVGMTHNKLAFQVRKHRAQRRDYRRLEVMDRGEWEQTTVGPSPSQQLAAQELLRECRHRLTAEELRLVDLRTQGHDWAEIAGQLGGTPQARRKQLARATDRVAEQLGLDHCDDE